MTARKLTRGQKLLVGLAMVLLLAGSAMAMRAHATPALAMATPKAEQGVLILRNETGMQVAGVELVCAEEPAGGGGSVGGDGIYAFSGYTPAEVIQCSGCIWIPVTLGPGEELRVMLNQPYASTELVSANWYLDARSLLQSIWKVSRCAIL